MSVYAMGYRAELIVNPELWIEIFERRQEHNWNQAVSNLTPSPDASGQNSYGTIVEWAEFGACDRPEDNEENAKAWLRNARELHAEWLRALVIEKPKED